LATPLPKWDRSSLRLPWHVDRPFLLARTLLPRAATAAVLIAGYLVLEWVSFIHEHNGLPVTPWNPGLGALFAVLILGGPAYASVLFAGVLLAEIFVLRTQLAWPVIGLMALTIAAVFTAAAILVRRRLHLDVGLSRVRDVLILLAAGTAASCISSALLGALLIGTSEMTLGDFAQAAIPLIVGDTIGIAVATPLVLRLLQRRAGLTRVSAIALTTELALYFIIVGLALWLIVGADSPDTYKFVSLLFLPVVAAGVRYGIDGSCLSLALTQLALVGVLRWYGHDAATFTEFQVIMLVLTMSGLLVGVVVSDRARALSLARAAEGRIRDMQAEATRAARMNMVSGMASAIAHEINQPMTAARALARSVQQLMQTEPFDTGRANGNLSNLVAQIDHAAGVVRRMRDFLRRGRPQFSTLQIGPVLEDALMLASPEASAKKTAIQLELEDSLPTIFGDRIQLQQVVLNLIHNGIEAIGAAERHDGTILVRAYPLKDASGIVISVIDNGIGVPADRPLFEPLTSTKGEGLGLGLSICASIVEAHGGRIWLHASERGATEFRFSLPSEPRTT
jgi:two-component system sensor kinase FixL